MTSQGRTPLRVLMLLENNPFPQDPRVRNEATALTRAGYRVTVIAPRAGDQPSRDTVGGIRVYRYAQPPSAPGALGYLLEYGTALIAMLILSTIVLLREGFDVIHAHNPPDLLVLVGGLHRLWGKRFVFDVHDLSPEMYHARFRTEDTGLLYRALQVFERWAFALADHVIVTNESYRTVALTRGGKSPDRVTVVRNGPDPQRVRRVPPDPALRAEAGFLIGYVGAMGRQDGVDHLLRALHHLRHDLGKDDFLCILVGRGDAMPELEALTARLELDRHVHFARYVPDGDLMKILSTVDAFAAPEPSNPFNDKSTMIKLTEYIAFERPIIAFDLPEHRVTAGDAACYARPNDDLDFARTIAAVMDDPSLTARAAQHARERYDSLIWEAQEPNLLAAYASLTRRAFGGRTHGRSA